MTETIIIGRREGIAVLPDNSVNWGDLGSSPYGSWNNWPSWKITTGTQIQVQYLDDQGSISSRIPNLIVLDYEGDLSVELDISDTGAFTGEETTITFVVDAENTFVSGRYYRWTITVDANVTYTVPILFDYFTSYTTNMSIETLEDVDVFASYTTSLSTNLGLVRNIQATALQGDPYVLDGYVEQLETSRTPKTLNNGSSIVTIDSTVKKFNNSSFNYAAESSLTVDLGSDRPSGTEDFTWEAWVYADSSLVNGAQIISSDQGGIGFDISAFNTGTGVTFDYDISIDSTAYGNSGLSTEFAYDTWHHVAFVRNGTSLAMYVNGTVDRSDTITGAGIIDTPTSNTVYIGDGIGGSAGWRGNIDEVRLSNSARYTGNFTPQSWPFYNDANTVLLLHAEDFTDDGGNTYSSDEYIILQQQGGSPVIKQKNPPQVQVVDYEGNPWDGTVDVVLRGYPKIVFNGYTVQAVNI